MAKNNSIGGSPLLQGEEKPELGNSPLNSTVHPDRLDRKKFSERKAEAGGDGSPMRILIYFVVVVALGAGAAFGIQTLIAENEDDSTDDTETTTETDMPTATIDVYDINSSELLNSTTINVPSEANLSNSTITSVGAGTGDGDTIDEVEYRNYETFHRVTFRLTATTLPRTEVGLSSSEDILTVTFPTTTSAAEGFTDGATVNTILSSIAFDAVLNSFELTMSEAVLYRVRAEGTDLIIDFATEDELEVESEQIEEPTTEEPASEEPEIEEEASTPETTTPGTDTLTNEFSQDKQFIINSQVTGNTVEQNQYYFYDEGSYFEFSFGVNNSVGLDFAPNSSAEYKNENGVDYIEWTIENLATEPLAVRGITSVTQGDLSAFIDMSGANFTSIERVSFENGTAVYRLIPDRRANFSLQTQESFDGSSQLLSILIQD